MRAAALVYRDAITPRGWYQLKEAFGEAVLELCEPDAQRYAANSFTCTPPGSADSVLVMPDGLSERLLDEIRERGVDPIPVDVSEFLKKGGGSVKCMIGDLGVALEVGSA